jgi:hypothetical protein
MRNIDPRRTDVALEFRAKPVGHHSAELQRILAIFRGAPPNGKHVLICTKPHREWMVAQLSGIRGQPVRVLHNMVFADRTEAEWAVFKLRWREHTGQDLPIE